MRRSHQLIQYSYPYLFYLSHARSAVLRDVFYIIAFSWDVTLFVIYVKI